MKKAFKVIGIILATISPTLMAVEPDYPEQIESTLQKYIDPIAHSQKYKNKECMIMFKINNKGYIYKVKALKGDVGLCNLLDEAVTESELRHKKFKGGGERTTIFVFKPKK